MAKTEAKKITAGLVFSWIFGILFFIAGLTYLLQGPVISGILFLVAFAVVLPPINKIVKEKMNFELSGWLKILIVLAIFIIIGVTMTTKPTITEQIAKNSEPIDTNILQTPTVTNYIIEITGTNGLEFSGSIGGGANQRSVQGSIPATYEVSDWPAVAVMQKKGTSGTLTVTIKKNGNVLNSQTTDADYGVVSVSSG